MASKPTTFGPLKRKEAPTSAEKERPSKRKHIEASPPNAGQESHHDIYAKLESMHAKILEIEHGLIAMESLDHSKKVVYEKMDDINMQVTSLH